MARTRRANRYCVDCGARLTYHSLLSNPRAPNEHRTLVYSCIDCTRALGRPKMLAIRRRRSEDPLGDLEAEAARQRARRPRRRPGRPPAAGGGGAPGG